MREILFRGKRIDNGEWIKGYYVKADCSSVESVILPNSVFADENIALRLEFDEWYEVIPETVGQYTGLTDKNGKKIFEGDIIECWSEGVCARGTVQQNKGGLWIIYPAWQKRIMWGLCPDEYSRTDVEVIGNIHDNPELLGGAENG